MCLFKRVSHPGAQNVNDMFKDGFDWAPVENACGLSQLEPKPTPTPKPKETKKKPKKETKNKKETKKKPKKDKSVTAPKDDVPF